MNKQITVGGKNVELSEAQFEKIEQIISNETSKYQAIEDLVDRDVFIRSVTMYYTGHVEAVSGQFIVLSNAAWIADTGRFADWLKTGKANEVEPMGDTMVAITAILDISPVQFKLPFEQK